MTTTTAKKEKAKRDPMAELRERLRARPATSEADASIQANKTYRDSYKKQLVERMVRDQISANQLSEETGVSQPTLSRWKREAKGKRKPQGESSLFVKGVTADSITLVIPRRGKMAKAILSKLAEVAG